MHDGPHDSRCVAIDLATDVGLVMEAVAASMDGGDQRLVDIDKAMKVLGRANYGHLQAALVVITMMLADVNCDPDKWRRQIPEFIANVASAKIA